MNAPVVMHYGMGTNSVAMLVGLMDRGERPELILSADTGGEKPGTYEHRAVIDTWLSIHGWPRIQTVKYRNKLGNELTLEADCLRRKTLPSIAFGFKTCSQRWKVRPQDYFIRDWPMAQEAWASGLKVTKLIGYDAGESHRAKNYSDEKFNVRYPLIEWGWDREDCIEAIKRAGLPLPGKSACFFCPSSKKSEVIELKQKHPELYARAIAMEQNAKQSLQAIKGLGRRYAWGDLEVTPNTEEQKEMPCGCYDGD